MRNNGESISKGAGLGREGGVASYMPHSSPPPRGFSLSSLMRSSILRMVIAASVANLIDFTCNGGRLDIA